MPLDFSYLNQFQRPAPAADPVQIWRQAKDADLVRKANEADFQYKRELLKDQTIQNDLKIQQQTQSAALQQQEAKDQQEWTNIYHEVGGMADLTPDQKEAEILKRGQLRVSAPAYLKHQSELANLAKLKPQLNEAQWNQIHHNMGLAANMVDSILAMKPEDRVARLPQIQSDIAAIDPSLKVDEKTILDDGFLNFKRAQLMTGLEEANQRKGKADATTAESAARVTVGTEKPKIAQAGSEATEAANKAALSTPNANNVTSAQQMEADAKAVAETRAAKAQEIQAARDAEIHRHNVETERRMAAIASGQGNSLPELQNTPKPLQAPAAAAYSKASIAYADAKATADDIQSVIDLVKSGNKAAGSNLPLLGVGALNAINGIKRMNKAEIDQYAGAGSLLDKITGKISGLAEGRPIPKDVLDDIEQLHKTLAEGATRKYNGEVDAINRSHGSNFKASAGSTPTVTNQQDYDKLPKGAKFIWNGREGVKP